LSAARKRTHQAAVSLCLIVRDGAGTLPNLLASVEGAFDELVLVDTGSTDATAALVKDWAQRTGTPCRVDHFDWIDDFSAARNYADSLAFGDWLCWADADDEIRGAQQLRGLAAQAPATVGAFYFDYAAEHDERGNCIRRTVRERLVRRGCGTWIQPVHETQQTTGNTGYAGPDIAEWVHRPPGDRVATRRNAEIVAKWVAADPTNPNALFYAGTEAGQPPDIDIDAMLFYLRRFLDVHPEWSDQRCLVCRYVALPLLFRGAHGQPECLDEATSLARDAIRERPDWSVSFLTLAEVAWQRGDAAAAQKWARRVIDRGPPKTFLPIDPRDYDELPRAIFDGVRIEPAWWSVCANQATPDHEDIPETRLAAGGSS
jgi:hypothetical protein